MRFGFSELFKEVEKKLICSPSKCEIGFEVSGISESREVIGTVEEGEGIL